MAKSTTKKAGAPVQLDTGNIQQIGFAKLAVSPLNARKDAVVGPDDELVASIKAHGLLQPLVGYIAKSGPAIVLICAGQRRLLALEHIAAVDTLIPVRIVDEGTAIEVSLAENLERKDMNPADELAAFQALIGTGAYDANRIAARFGFDRRYVRRRLKMGVLAPEILAALREGTIGIGGAEAYAASDDQKLQLKIFKTHCRPNAWQPHDPKRVLREILGEGITADSRAARFIGGVEAYEAEGGSTKRDEAFTDLFEDAAFGTLETVRLSDFTIINKLLERAKKDAARVAEQLARDKYPFVTGIDWMDPFGQYGAAMPKLPKKSELQAVEPFWNMKVVEAAEIAAKEPGAQVIALIGLNEAGEVQVEEGRFLITRAAWSKAKPKEADTTSGYRQPTAEERAAQERERSIHLSARNFYGRSLIGETPGFEVTSCEVDWKGKLKISLTAAQADLGDITVEEGSYRSDYSISEEALAPFIDQATAAIDAMLTEQAKATDTFAETLAELEKKPIDEWPAVAIVRVDMGDDTEQLLIARAEKDGKPVLSLIDEMGDPWFSDGVAKSIEIIRDQVAESKPSILIFDTVEAYAAEHAGQCRMCGCTEDAACDGGCSWSDQLQTLCSSPECLAKAGVSEKVSEAA